MESDTQSDDRPVPAGDAPADARLGGAAGEREELFLVVYEELRRLARIQMTDQRRRVTLQPTALVHEAYLRLMGGAERPFDDRTHFFRTAAKAMRTILVDVARARNAAKRGGGETHVTLANEHEGVHEGASARVFEALAIHEALGRLERLDPRAAHVVELRFFCGLSIAEIAAALGTTQRTVHRDWDTARAWLYAELSP